jgi:hopene-associated glycosyltransferase HpnB
LAILAITAILAILIWLYLLLAHGAFWRIKKRLAPPHFNGQSSCRIAAIIPARNEADVVGQSIASLLRQIGSHSVHIFLVDDGSSDGTAEIARQAAERAGKSAALTVIEGKPLPTGWTGKLWAVQQGIECAQKYAPHFFFLADADIQHAPDSVAALVSIAETGPYDLASFMVKLHCASFAEKLLIPAFVFFFFQLYPPSWIANPRRKIAGAAGGSILIRLEALKRAGGITAIRNEIIDDCAFARAVKRQGGTIWLGLNEASFSLRAYSTFSEIGRMISRTAFNQLNHSVLLLLAAIIGLTITYLLPPLLLLTQHAWPVTLGAIAWLLMSIGYFPMVRFYRLSPFWALSLPLSAIFYLGATLQSAFKFWSGQGGEWKGRAQDSRLPKLP